MMTTSDVADLLGITPSGVRDLVARGTLKPVRAGTRPLRFRPEHVHALTATRGTKAAAAFWDHHDTTTRKDHPDHVA